MIVTQDHPHQKTAGLVLLALALPATWWVYHPVQPLIVDANLFLVFHTAVEIVAIIVAALVFITGYRAVLSRRNGAVVLLGVSFLGVALLDFLHAMSYAGLPNVFTVNTPQKSIFFWLCARLLAACAILAYAWLPRSSEVSVRKKRLALGIMVMVVSVLAFAGLRQPDQLPAFFVAGQGLTPLKIGLEWVIVGLHLLTLVVLWVRRFALADECIMALGFAVTLSAVSELFFTMLGINDKDLANVLGHVYKVAAYVYLFHATFNEALNRPLQRLNLQHLREEQVLKAAPDGILWVDQNGQILMANPAIESLSGYKAQELIGCNVDIFLPPHLRQRHGHAMRSYFTEPRQRAMGAIDLALMRRDGVALPVDISLGHWADLHSKYAIAYIRDLTERKQFEESLRHRATHDQLTGLPNRWLFNHQLNQALLQARRNQRQVAVLMLDLDDFKTINDSYGHTVGDSFLIQVAQRLRATLREHDMLARLGGDEFAILIGDVENSLEAIKVAEKLLVVMENTFLQQKHELHASVSIGLAFYPRDALEAHDLVRYADMAMYQAKRSAHGTYACFSTQLELSVRENMLLHLRLKDALTLGQLELYYQPQFDGVSKKMVGVEALLRWHDPELGQVSPARFIPVAETTGLILPISTWVLEKACQQIGIWHRAGTPLAVAVNFSAQQFRQGKLATEVQDALERAGAPAHLLKIEITESIAMEQPEAAREQLNELVALGCAVALDDFGTGYSSLAYLKALPVTILKIDRTFIKDLPVDQSDAKICRAIIALAHSLDMSLIAEGVETEEQLEFLRDYGCETFQGWLFAKAMPAAEITALVRQHAVPHVQSVE